MLHLLWLRVNDSLVSIGHDPIKKSFVIVTGKKAWTRKYFYYETFEALAQVCSKYISEEDLRENMKSFLAEGKIKIDK